MFKDKFINSILEGKIIEGVKHFAIFPFGENGRRVKDCLSVYYGIEADWIVDNNLHRFNAKIVDLESFKKSYKPDVLIILTAENKGLNSRLYESLKEFVPVDNICNLLSIRDGSNREITTQFNLKDIFGLSETECLKRNDNKNTHNDASKIKIRFLYTVYAHWNSIDSIISSFAGDERYDVKIILGYQKSSDSIKKRISKMNKLGYSYFTWDEYDCETDRPDILVVSHLWDETKLRNYRENIKLVIVASMSLVLYGNSIENFVSLSKIGDRLFKPDYYLFDGYVYDKVKNTPFFTDRVKKVGNAKFDGIYHSCLNRTIPSQWSKLENKKTVLWASDHGITDGLPHKIRDEISFDIFAKSIFEYFRNNSDMALIFRPHPHFFVELIEYNIWTKQDLEQFRRIIDDTPNVILDETESYDVAFSISDAIITDCMCGILCSALPTLKPIGVLFRGDKRIESCAPDLVKEYASIDSEKKLYDFFDNVRNGIDSSYPKRKSLSDRYIDHFDGNNGKRIKKLIEKIYIEKTNR